MKQIYEKILINSLSSDFDKIRDDVLTIISVLKTNNILYTPSIIKEKAENNKENTHLSVI